MAKTGKSKQAVIVSETQAAVTAGTQGRRLSLVELQQIRQVKAAANGKAGLAACIANKLGISIGAARKAIRDVDGRIANYGQRAGKAGMSLQEFDGIWTKANEGTK